MQKKLFIFTGALTSGGAERVISIISSKFFKHFEEIEIIMYYDKEIFYDLNREIKLRILEKETKSKNILKNILWLRKNIPSKSIFLSFSAPFNMIAILAFLFKDMEIIVSERSDPNFVPTNKLIQKIRDFLYYFADRIICQSEESKNYFNKKIRKKIKVINNPIYISEEVGSALLEKKENEIVTVGRLEKEKNQRFLIKVFSEFLKIYPNYKLIIYGEGKERKNLENYIRFLEIEDKVKLPGTTKDIHRKIKKSKIFILTSDYEGMPNALLEAMSLGLPCITTKVSGIQEIVKNKNNGIIVKNNSQEILKEIIKIIENNNYAYSLGYEATKIYENLNEEKIAKKWLEVLN